MRQPGFDATAMADVLAGACADLVTPSVRAQIDSVEWEGASIVVGTLPECAPFDVAILRAAPKQAAQSRQQLLALQ